MRMALVTLHGWMVMYVVFQYLCLGKRAKGKIKERKKQAGNLLGLLINLDRFSIHFLQRVFGA